MSGPDKKLLIAVFVVWTVLLLLFANGVRAEPLIQDNGDTVTIDKETFSQMGQTIVAQQQMLARQSNKLEFTEQQLDSINQCVRESAAHGVAVTPCLNVTSQNIIGHNAQNMKNYKRFQQNTVEF